MTGKSRTATNELFPHDTGSSGEPSKQHILFIFFSSMVASFDFLIYFYLADIVSITFFPKTDNAFVAQLQLLSLLSIGFLSRPLGGLLIGRFGDVNGRKPALLISLCFLVVTTLIMACLPTYAQVGLLAPVLFIIVRLLQGMAFGAYAPLSWVYIAEHTSRRNMTFYCSLAVAGLIAGNLFAVILSKFLFFSLTHQELVANGWRIPALVGGVLSAIALFFWRFTKETPVFKDHLDKRSVVPQFINILPTLKQTSVLTLSLSISFVHSSLVIVSALFLPELIVLKYDLSYKFVSYGTGMGLLSMFIGCIFYGMLANRFGIGRALIAASIILIAVALGFYAHLIFGEGGYIFLLYSLLGFCSGMIGLFPSALIRLFPTTVRLTSVSITFNSAYALNGFVLPLVLIYSTELIGFAPAIFLTFIGILTFILGIYLLKFVVFNGLDSIKSKVESLKSR